MDLIYQILQISKFALQNKLIPKEILIKNNLKNKNIYIYN